jgi:hypothetical protein
MSASILISVALSVSRLWIMPTIIVLVVATSFGRLDLSLIGFLVILAGTLVGALIGLMRARTQLQSIDVPGRKIVTKPNVLMVLIFAAIVVAKAVLRGGASAGVHDTTNFALFVSAASICAQRLQFYRLFRRAAAGG